MNGRTIALLHLCNCVHSLDTIKGYNISSEYIDDSFYRYLTFKLNSRTKTIAGIFLYNSIGRVVNLDCNLAIYRHRRFATSHYHALTISVY